MMRSFRRILIDLDFLLRSAQIWKKCFIFVNLGTITQEGKKETRQMTPFYSSTFWALTVCDIHNIPGGSFLGRNFLRRFTREEFDGWEFSRCDFSGGDFPRTVWSVLLLFHQIKDCLFSSLKIWGETKSISTNLTGIALMIVNSLHLKWEFAASKLQFCKITQWTFTCSC